MVQQQSCCGRVCNPKLRTSDKIYFIFVVRCATHQAALSAKSSIIGIVASAFGSVLHEAITGVAVRLFKYVINVYYEEFCSQVHTWVSADLEVVGPDDADDAGRLRVPA